jgi:hypothetical protein
MMALSGCRIVFIPRGMWDPSIRPQNIAPVQVRSNDFYGLPDTQVKYVFQATFYLNSPNLPLIPRRWVPRHPLSRERAQASWAPSVAPSW